MLKKLMALLEDKIHDCDAADVSAYNEGYAAACQWILELVEEKYMREEREEPAYNEGDDADDEW